MFTDQPQGRIAVHVTRILGGGIMTSYPAVIDQTDAPASTTSWGAQYYNSSSTHVDGGDQFVCFWLA
jgi:hypothetical protein